MLSVQASKIVPGALGLYVQKEVAEGEVVAVEHARFLSAPAQAVHPVHHNRRYAWSMVENILKEFPTTEALEGLLSELRKDAYATGLAEASWALGDTQALDWLARAYKQSPYLIREVYNIMCTTAINAGLATRNLRVPGLAREIQLIDTNLHGFFPLFARINHSCAPNIKLEPPLDVAGPLALVALRPLQAGEELSFHYLGEGIERSAQRRELLQQFAFRCACPQCRQLCALLECTKKADKHCPCQRAHYCCPEHQKLDWARHKGAEHV
jgi:hypothetical protein